MKILTRKESAAHEKRVALTPETVKKLIDLGFEIHIEKDAGKEAGFLDSAYEKAGASIAKEPDAIAAEVDLLVQVAPLDKKDLKVAKPGAIAISLMKPYQNAELIKAMAKAKVTSLALELIPRISRAQAMDVLSSQSNLAGYQAVVDASSEFGRAMPMMMTAAGTIPPARVLVMGAGVAGLQAIATARRLGAIVSAFDVRAVAKEQVESLGAAFVEVPSDETGDAAGGYAKEMSDDYKKRQEARLMEVVQTQDIIITTALIPGKPAPKLISEEMVKSMKPGSVIYDLAVEAGGNAAFAEYGKTVVKNGVKIIGHANVPSRIAYDASQVFARNILNLLKIMVDSTNKTVVINLDDEIIKGSCLTHNGDIVHANFK